MKGVCILAKLKTTEAQRRAVAKYQETIDRVNCRFPKGTKDRIANAGYKMNAFIIDAVLEKLDKIENSNKESQKYTDSMLDAYNARAELPDFMK